MEKLSARRRRRRRRHLENAQITHREMHTFSKMGMAQNSRNVYFSEIRAPAGASDRQK